LIVFSSQPFLNRNCWSKNYLEVGPGTASRSRYAIPTVLLVTVIGGRWVAGQALVLIEDIWLCGRQNHRTTTACPAAINARETCRASRTSSSTARMRMRFLKLINRQNCVETQVQRRGLGGRSAKGYKLVTFHSLLIRAPQVMHPGVTRSLAK
jgi:hypothetical protein